MVGSIAEWREPPVAIGSRPHRSESPTGYSSTGCSPAEPASASPVTDDHSRSGPSSKCAALLCAAILGVISTLHAG